MAIHKGLPNKNCYSNGLPGEEKNIILVKLALRFTLRQTNIAMENPARVDVLPVGKGGFPLLF